MGSGARGHKTKSISIVTLFFFHPFVFTLSNFSCQIGYSSRITHTSKKTQKARQNTRNKPNTRMVLGIRNLVSAVCFCGYNICPHTWMTYSCMGTYSCFEEGCRKKWTRQSRKVLWVVLSSPFFKEIWKNGTRGHGPCLKVPKESNKAKFDSYSFRNSVLIISHITFRDCRVHIFLRQPFSK